MRSRIHRFKKKNSTPSHTPPSRLSPLDSSIRLSVPHPGNNISGSQFQSVFTTKAPLSLSRLCTMKLKDMANCGRIPSEALPSGMQESSPVMEDFDISVAGILKLLKNLKPGKAAGPDSLKPILLKELRKEIAPIMQVIFERSIKTGKLPSEWCCAQVSPIFKKGDKSSPANYRPISLTSILC